jgi:hypothetical protein
MLFRAFLQIQNAAHSIAFELGWGFCRGKYRFFVLNQIPNGKAVATCSNSRAFRNRSASLKACAVGAEKSSW